jgi:predicted RNA-binding protein with PIN domain
MRYLIDGHNLIPKLGLTLHAPDDETELIARLQEFCRQQRARVEVYFDGAPAGQAGTRPAGLVTAHFVRQGLSADAAIETRLACLGARAREWTVVSSDRRVRQAAHAAHASVLTSEEFARRLATRPESSSPPSPKTTGSLTSQEVEEWLKTFEQRPRP